MLIFLQPTGDMRKAAHSWRQLSGVSRSPQASSSAEGLNIWKCCSHAFRETNSLRRIIQIVECIYYTGEPKAESPLSPGPRPVFVKTLYTLSVRAQIYLPQIPETSLNKGKRKIHSKLTHDSYALSLGS